MFLNTTAIPKPASLRGFTLIELMVALVVGLIVVLAATGFVVSVAKANSENIQVTRLTQELRAVSEVMSREIRRARYVSDAVGLIGTGGAANNDTLEPRDKATNTFANPGNCIVFKYDEPPTAVAVSHSIRLEGNNVVLNPSSTNCSGGNVINSPQVRITALQFARDATNPSRYDITVSGQLASVPPISSLYGLTRTFRETVYVRSGQVD
jgi:prepilin-type N-terminal cleavage/methylation domain-containing protein